MHQIAEVGQKHVDVPLEERMVETEVYMRAVNLVLAIGDYFSALEGLKAG